MLPVTRLRISITSRLPRVGGDGRSLIDVARIAVVAVIVVVADDGTLGQRVIIKFELVRSTFSVFLILDASSVTNLSASRGGHVEALSELPVSDSMG